MPRPDADASQFIVIACREHNSSRCEMCDLRSARSPSWLDHSLIKDLTVATNVHLTPELERFTRECVERGRYNNGSEVVRASLRLLQDAEDRHRDFRRMLQEVEEEADREGDVSLETALANMDAIIAASEQ
jgi:antitoxin ParD1/3/4